MSKDGATAAGIGAGETATMPVYAIILTLAPQFSAELAHAGVVEAIAEAAREGRAPAVPTLIALGQSPNFAQRFVERLAYLIRLRKAGVLRAAGPFAELSDGMYLVHAKDEAAARRVLEEDPLYLAGFIERDYTIRRWLVAI